MFISNIFKICNKKGEKSGKLSLENLHTNVIINEFKYGINNDLFHNSSELDAEGFERYCCRSTVFRMLSFAPIF